MNNDAKLIVSVLCGCLRWLFGAFPGERGSLEVHGVAGLACQASVQVPSLRVRPRLSSLRRFNAAARLCSQALFFSTPR